MLGPYHALKKVITKLREPQKTILHGIDGVIRDGEMLLVLGRPGSGCSTLLKTLAGFTAGYNRWEGEVKYNGVDIRIIDKLFRGDIAYNPEVDTHFPHLTVEQTLQLAVKSRAPGARREGHAKNYYIAQNVDMLATTFGLRHTLKTKVGDDYVRGVSGGERKRVSLAEMLAGRISVGYWDNPTRGLDASTAYEFAKVLRANADVQGTAAVVAAYQAGENLTVEFDKVTVLYLGRQIFFGTLLDAKEFFEGLGFASQPRQTTADFLTAITDHTGRRVRQGFEHKAPHTPDEFVREWKASPYYAQLQHEMANFRQTFGTGEASLQAYKKAQASQKAKAQRKDSIYLANISQQFRSTVLRGYQRIIGDTVYLGAFAFSSIFMSVINGSVFIKTSSSTSGYFSKGGIIFFCVLFNALQTMSEIATQYAQRPIVQKQSAYGFYHPFIDTLSSISADWPFKIINILIFDIIIYFMVGLKQTASAFFIFFLVTTVSTFAMSALFRTVAAVTKRAETATAIAGILVLVLTIYTGYVIPIPSMHPWFRWLQYINPISYGFEALMVNEFHGKNGVCTGLIPFGPGYENASIMNQVCAVTGAVPGRSTVSGDDYLEASFEYSYGHLWRNVAIIIAFTGFFIVTCAIATEYNQLAPSKGEFLIFRKGHEPEHVKKALDMGEAVEDIEAQQGNGEILVGTKTNVSQFGGLIKSKDLFTWDNINYDITMPDGATRRLLSNVTGYIKPGSLTALMGESGAGKTTLLNVLAKRIDTGIVLGSTLVNGLPIGKAFQRRTGYVQQQDLHLAESTVREALRFSALLRQPKEVSIQEKYDYVEKVIEMLEMEDYVEAVIGSPGNGLNVEQRKRTTIGLELAAKPALLLFLDEPTSGLDSQSAWSIVKLLRKLANSGQAILCTIHQPSSVLFTQFDRLLLLKKGGRTVYFGDVGDTAQHVIEYFESNNAFKCPKEENPAEYILNVIGAGATAHVDRDWGDVWANSPNASEMEQEKEALKSEYKELSLDMSTDEAEDADGSFAVGLLTQYKAVQARLFQNYWRAPDYVNSKILLNTVAGLFLGFTFYQEENTVAGLQNKLFAIFMAVILSMPLMNQLMPRWESLTALYGVREKPSKMYHWSTFVLSNVVAEIPFNLVAGTLFFIPWYFTVGFENAFDGSSKAERGAYQWLMIMLFEIWWSTFGQAVAAMSPNGQTATTFTTLLGGLVITFNGVLQPLSQLVEFWHWMYYVSPFTWLISGLLSNAISGSVITCATKEINIFNPPSGQTCIEYAGAFVKVSGKILNPDASADCEYCRYSVADQYLESVNMAYSERWRNAGFMCAYIVFNTLMVFGGFYLTKVAKPDFSWIVNKLKKRRTKS
ncbi:brefeldin A efflux transporter Bfr1 [Bisporella sp. PMI_857]|nr:brefeldin A efflux transporter Bfr1 [Bisporella sp. PMI_857]